MEPIAIYDQDDGRLYGMVARDATGWRAQTIFGYPFARADSQAAAERLVRERGIATMQGVWQYLDPDDQEWHSCIIKQAQAASVTVVRTNAMGYEEPDDYKHVILTQPDETTLIKA